MVELDKIIKWMLEALNNIPDNSARLRHELEKNPENIQKLLDFIYKIPDGHLKLETFLENKTKILYNNSKLADLPENQKLMYALQNIDTGICTECIPKEETCKECLDSRAEMLKHRISVKLDNLVNLDNSDKSNYKWIQKEIDESKQKIRLDDLIDIRFYVLDRLIKKDSNEEILEELNALFDLGNSMKTSTNGFYNAMNKLFIKFRIHRKELINECLKKGSEPSENYIAVSVEIKNLKKEMSAMEIYYRREKGFILSS